MEGSEEKRFKTSLNSKISPFKLPSDEEVFITRELERQKRAEQKEIQKVQKIWEKTTASTVNPLKRPKFDKQSGAKDLVSIFPPTQRGIVSEALELIQKEKNIAKVKEENQSNEEYIN